MKKVVVRGSETPGQSAKEVFTMVLSHSPHRSLSVDEIRKRVRLVEALESAEDEVLLEEADWQVFCDAVNTFPWSQANRGLLMIIDDVLKAETVNVKALSIVSDKKEEREEASAPEEKALS